MKKVGTTDLATDSENPNGGDASRSPSQACLLVADVLGLAFDGVLDGARDLFDQVFFFYIFLPKR